ncbi:MAG: SCO family protein [Gammaproteobacteria bacterium]|nr:SCO family protein [Gammaproteobacteria bacterium]
MSIKSNGLIVASAIVAMSVGFWLSTIQQERTSEAENKKENAIAQARKNFSPIQGAILSPARKISVPALIKDNGQVFTSDDLKGRWHFLFFGYTHCPDICPVTMGVVARAKKNAKAVNHIFPDVVFVSVDPERDNVELLAEYVQYFDKDFIGVTGSKDLIKALTLQMSVVYMVAPQKADKALAVSEDSDSGSYTVDHSSALLLINPEGKLVAFFNPPHDPKTILKDFQTVVNLSD